MPTDPSTAPASDSDEHAVRELEDARFNAIVTGEFDAFAELSHPDLRYTHSNAVVDTLDSYLARCRDGFYVYHSVAHPIDKITVIGDVALVFGEMKADLTAAYVCRLLRYMDRKGVAIAVPRREAGVTPEPFLSFTSGYVQRAQDELPQQGSRRPWQVYQNYFQDMFTIRYGRIADSVMHFGRKGVLP